MSRNNTGNPIGSKAFPDFEDNVKNLDEAVNSQEPAWTDRFGQPRRTMAGVDVAVAEVEAAAAVALDETIPKIIQDIDNEASASLDAKELIWEGRFQSGQDDREQRFNTFIASSGYQFAGDYAAGIEITQYNQLVRDENGEFWRVSGQVDLPYMTTGAGIPEGDALVPAGDAVLRQDLANPNKGAAMVAYGGSNVHDALDDLRKFRDFKDLPTLLGSTSLVYGGGAGQVASGDIIRTREEGFSYQVEDQGIDDPDLSTAGGVKIRVLPTAAGHYNFAAMNPAMDGVTDDFPKLRKLLDKPGHASNARYPTSPGIYFPNGSYFISQTLELKQSVRLFGNASGLQTDSSAQLIFPPDAPGIVINRWNTLNNAQDIPATTGADTTIIEGLCLIGGGGTNRLAHGIWGRARSVIRNCRVQGFRGCGIAIWAASNGPFTHTLESGDPQGNANSTFIETVFVGYNGEDGLRVDGYDANAGVYIGVSARSNGRYGVRDSSFLGNTHIGHHVQGNGLQGGFNPQGSSSYVTYEGRRYAAHPQATEQELAETVPGTNEMIWVFSRSGGTHSTIPLWESGKPVGTYFVAGSYRSDNLNARNVFIGCYSESGAAGAVINGPSLVLGGLFGEVLRGSKLEAENGGELTAKSFSTTPGSGASAALDSGASAFRFGHSEADGAYWEWTYLISEKRWAMRGNNLNGRQPHFLTSSGFDGRQYTFGAEHLYIGSDRANRVLMGPTNAASSVFPSSGTFERRQIGFGRYPVPGGKIGWVCTTGGDAGSTAVFKEFGSIDE